jgi:hypothetical protein
MWIRSSAAANSNRRASRPVTEPSVASHAKVVIVIRHRLCDVVRSRAGSLRRSHLCRILGRLRCRNNSAVTADHTRHLTLYYTCWFVCMLGVSIDTHIGLHATHEDVARCSLSAIWPHLLNGFFCNQLSEAFCDDDTSLRKTNVLLNWSWHQTSLYLKDCILQLTDKFKWYRNVWSTCVTCSVFKFPFWRLRN